MKTCSKCKVEKELADFYKSKSKKDGYGFHCKLCIKKYQIKIADKIKQRYLDNADKIKQYRIDNADKIKQYKKQYRIDNADKIKQYAIDNANKIKQWRHSERGKLLVSKSNKKYNHSPEGKLFYKISNHKRRALIKTNTPVGKHFTVDDIKLKLKLQDIKCVYCKTSIKDYFEIDHIMPLSRGGSNEASNIQLLCEKCNRGVDGKGAKLPHDFAKQHGMLF